MQREIVRRKVHKDDGELGNIHPILRRIYRARNVASLDELDRELSNIPSYKTLKNMDAVVKRLAQALAEQQSIVVIGDFDADGATSTALAVSALHAFGSNKIDYLVPDRFKFGYGLTPEIVDVAAKKKPDLIVTVDNGISSLDGVAQARKLNIDVIVTDHHLPGKTQPQDCLIVNPNQHDDTFESKNLAGVGVIFYVMIALRAYLKEQNWFERQNIDIPNMANFLDLVALGTVADVVPLDKVNRIFVHQGLRRIRGGAARFGIQALMLVAGKEYQKISVRDCGFALAPRINAAGRLDDMSLGIQCLLTNDFNEAVKLARQLDQLNRERHAIEVQMQRQAFDIVDQLHLDKKLPLGICLYDAQWHQGVVGLVASRVKEQHHRPVIAFAKTDDGILKGSARSISGVHIRDVLEAVATQHPHLITKFGGHAMAAGLSLLETNFDAFQTAFAEEVERQVNEEDLKSEVHTDGELANSDYTLEFAELLREAGPWGQGFPEPVFDGEFTIVEQHIVGKRHLKLTLQASRHPFYLEGIAFNVDLSCWPNHRAKHVRVAYKLDVNEFRGNKKLQLLVEEIQA